MCVSLSMLNVYHMNYSVLDVKYNCNQVLTTTTEGYKRLLSMYHGN